MKRHNIAKYAAIAYCSAVLGMGMMHYGSNGIRAIDAFFVVLLPTVLGYIAGRNDSTR